MSADPAMSIEAAQKGVWTPAGFVPAFYRANPHSEAELGATVTSCGMPIHANKEVLTLAMVPPPFRWAIGPAKDGAAEVIEQHVFEEKLKMKIREEYASRGVAYEDDVDKEPRPRVERYVAKKWDTNLGKVVPLGSNLDLNPAPEEPEKLYSASADRFMTREELEAEEKAEARRRHDLEGENERLRAQLAELRGEDTPEPGGEPKTDPEANTTTTETEAESFTAPCGKPCKSAAGVSAHARNCDACKEAKAA